MGSPCWAHISSQNRRFVPDPRRFVPVAFNVLTPRFSAGVSGGEMMRLRTTAVLAALALVFGVATATAQSQTGEIFGKVTDESEIGRASCRERERSRAVSRQV